MTRRNHSAFGSRREAKVALELEKDGWHVTKTTAPTAAYDLKATRPAPGTSYCEGLLVQVKGTERSPWVYFTPAMRRALKDEARKAGCTPRLAWWPPHGDLQWLGEAEWPSR